MLQYASVNYLDEGLPVNNMTSVEINLASDYRLMTEQVLPELGFRNPEAAGVPVFEEVSERLAPISTWLVDRASAGINDRLVIAPLIGSEEGMGVSRLITAQDDRVFKYGYVWTAMWGDEQGNGGTYTNHSSVHDNELKTMWDVAILLGDKTNLDSNELNPDTGLMHTNMTIKEQRHAHLYEAIRHERAGRQLVSATVGQLVVDSQALKAEGGTQRSGVTRLIHYPAKKIGGYPYVPRIFPVDGRLGFDGIFLDGTGRDDGGIRRSVRI